MTAFVAHGLADGTLSRYECFARDPDEEDKRCIFLHQSIPPQIDLRDGTIPQKTRVRIHMELAHFVRGYILTVSEAPAYEKNSQMKGLDGFGNKLWELRMRYPTNYRLFGVIPAKDMFVGLTLLPRTGINFNVTGQDVLDLYSRTLKNNECTAKSSCVADGCFSNWRLI